MALCVFLRGKAVLELEKVREVHLQKRKAEMFWKDIYPYFELAFIKLSWLFSTSLLSGAD